MKIYSRLVAKIRNNKTRIKNAVGIVTVAVGLLTLINYLIKKDRTGLINWNRKIYKTF